MVLINTTFIGEKEFNAVVYDMNTEHFVANVSVYGMKEKPENRLGVISLMEKKWISRFGKIRLIHGVP